MDSKSIKISLLSLALGLCQWAANAAEAVKIIDGKKYQEYVIKKGETLYGISRKFKTTIAELEKVNPKAKKGLQIDEKIYVPVGVSSNEPQKGTDTKKAEPAKPATEKKTEPAKPASNATTNGEKTVVRELVEHKVLSGETLTSIAKKYNTSIGDLKTRNESVLKRGLMSGTTLKVYKNSALKNSVPPATNTQTAEKVTPKAEEKKAEQPKANEKKAESAKQQETKKNDTKVAEKKVESQKSAKPSGPTTRYKVQKGESLYSICKRQGCTVSEAEELNPALKKRTIIEGEWITLPPVSHGTKGEPTSKANTPKADDQSGVTVHEVKKGETLTKIAKDYNIAVDDIERLNPGVKKNGIQAGKPLIMPSTSKQIAQKNSSNDFRVHKIQKNETVFSISQKFGVTPAELAANNNVKSGIKEGQLLAIPASAAYKEKTGVASAYRQNAPATEKNTNVAHTVVKGETMFSICKTYKVTEKEMLKANPDLKDGLKAGHIVFIPRSEMQQRAWSNSYYVSTQGNNRVNMAVVLPLKSEDGLIDANTDKFLEFYQGVLLAVKKLKEQNVWVNLHVFNSGKSESEIKAILDKEEMKNIDFLIGPAYKAQFPAISEYAIANNVKIIVPFSTRTEEMKNNPNIFLVNAPKHKYAQEVASRIEKEFQQRNVVLVKFKNEDINDKAEIADSIAARLKKGGTNVTSIEFTNAEDLKAVMKEDVPNIVLTTSTDRVALTQLLPSINSLLIPNQKKKFYNVKIFGYNEWTKHQTISKDLFIADTYIASTYDIDFDNENTKNFIGDFRKYYGQEPGNTQPMYAGLGYDIALYFGKAVAVYGKNFEEGLPFVNSHINMVQSDFSFRKYETMGGYYNSDFTLSVNNGSEGHVIIEKPVEVIPEPIKLDGEGADSSSHRLDSTKSALLKATDSTKTTEPVKERKND